MLNLQLVAERVGDIDVAHFRLDVEAQASYSKKLRECVADEGDVFHWKSRKYTACVPCVGQQVVIEAWLAPRGAIAV